MRLHAGDGSAQYREGRSLLPVLAWDDPLAGAPVPLFAHFRFQLLFRGQLVHSFYGKPCYIEKDGKWAASSVGRARRSQRRGRGFESHAVHQLLPCCARWGVVPAPSHSLVRPGVGYVILIMRRGWRHPPGPRT